MKRSEMLKIISNNLYDTSLDSSEEQCKATADFILSIIEEQGMSPPGYMKPIPFESDGRQYPLVPGDFKNDEGIWCTPGIQEWEPENEKT